MTGRNQDAIRRTTAGLLKLLYPHRTPETLLREELAPCLTLATECRSLVVEQLARMAPGEFSAAPLSAQYEFRNS
jgi:predicted ATP-dependent Lon-type protease